MDVNPHSFDALYSEPRERSSLLSWDELLCAVRRSPQLTALDAAVVSRSCPEASVPSAAEPSVPPAAGSTASTEAAGPDTANRAPTWDGLNTVIAALRGKDLLPETLPTTRSPTVMLVHLIEELALVFAGHRGDRPKLGVIGSEPGIDRAQVRFETECITWSIAGRLGLRAAATGSLKRYLKDGDLMPPISRDRVLYTVDAVEGLFGGAITFGETIRHEIPSLFSLDEQLAV